MGDAIKYLVPVGMLGGGFSEQFFLDAMDETIDFIAVDSGSTDGGANNLGQNLPFFSRAAVKRDLTLMLTAARRLDIPMLVGSCGGSGGDWNLNWVWEIVQEIAQEQDLHFTTAVISAELASVDVAARFERGEVTPLHPAPEIDAAGIESMHRIVAMMGMEPYIEALRGGADVVLAGRSSDAALMAAIPVSRGFPAGLAWHAAKIMECGGAAVTQMAKPEGMICTITQDYFELEPVSPEQTCTPQSIASHSLYETSNPFVMHEPGGVMHLESVEYEAASDRAVRVRGSDFEFAPYTVRLEGAELVGYRSTVLGGVTDPSILRDFEHWITAAQDGAHYTLVRALGEEVASSCRVSLRVYGRNAVLGERETRPFANDHEVGVLIDVLAPTQEIANNAAAQVGHTILHFPVPAWHGLVSNLAFPFAPHTVDLGPAYTFGLNHVIQLEDPLELFPIRYQEV